MRIENCMKCPMFFPYAGSDSSRGKELAAGKVSDEIESSRYFNKLLQRDWKAGRIKVYLNELDKSVLNLSAKEAASLPAVAKSAISDAVAAPIVLPKAVAPKEVEAPKKVESPKIAIDGERPTLDAVNDSALLDLSLLNTADVNMDAKPEARKKELEQGLPAFDKGPIKSEKQRLSDIKTHMGSKV